MLNPYEFVETTPPTKHVQYTVTLRFGSKQVEGSYVIERADLEPKKEYRETVATAEAIRDRLIVLLNRHAVLGADLCPPREEHTILDPFEMHVADDGCTVIVTYSVDGNRAAHFVVVHMAANDDGIYVETITRNHTLAELAALLPAAPDARVNAGHRDGRPRVGFGTGSHSAAAALIRRIIDVKYPSTEKATT